mgnify:CR=1 FL=1
MRDTITPAVVKEICRRSQEGEGVEAIIVDMKLPMGTMIYLRDHHHDDIAQAKKEQIRRKKERESGLGRT